MGLASSCLCRGFVAVYDGAASEVDRGTCGREGLHTVLPPRTLVDRRFTQTLVVSQWTSCLSLVSDYLTEAGVIHVK